MSWREIIPELSILLFLTDKLNKVALAISNAENQENTLTEELESIERELEDLKDRTSSKLESITEKKQKETLDTKKEDNKNIASKIDNLSSNIDNLNENLGERKLAGQELNYIIVRRVELLRRKGEIITIELPKVTLFRKLAERRYTNTEELLPRLKEIQTSIDEILTALDNLIQSISAIPVTGPPLASILTTVLSIVEQKIYLPLKVALVLWEQNLNSLRTVFFKEEN